jgi:hypothetical protein
VGEPFAKAVIARSSAERPLDSLTTHGLQVEDGMGEVVAIPHLGGLHAPTDKKLADFCPTSGEDAGFASQVRRPASRPFGLLTAVSAFGTGIPLQHAGTALVRKVQQARDPRIDTTPESSCETTSAHSPARCLEREPFRQLSQE